jgi:hypothetical protein
MSSRHSALLSLAIFLSLASPLIIYAETKVLTAEATYTIQLFSAVPPRM